MDSSEPKTEKAEPESRRRGQARLGTDEQAAARIRGAIKASLDRARGEWVQLEEKDEPAPPPPEAQAVVPGESGETPVAATDNEIEVREEPTELVEEATGRVLREAREQRGTTLDEASSDTRIAKRYLEALEDGKSPERLPSRAYARFFLRDYARYLGVPDDEIGDAYRGGPDESEGDLEPLSVAGSRPRRQWVMAALIAAVVVGVIALGVTRFGTPRQEPLPTTPRSSPSAAIAAPPVAPTATPTLAPATEIVAVLRVSEESWVEAIADGETTVQELLVPDDVHRIRADETLQLLLGNAGGVSLLVNGKSVPTGGDGEVARLSFELRDGRVVTVAEG
ncbi:MAG TPA: RodZ domain-containing protein [Actinomycetota bacterium]|nr:RodZ domain-containing protein [Actinomycetota bacterium]